MRMMRRREPSQVMALAAVAMVSIVAILAFVIDASSFFVIRRELQNAADAGALAGALYLSPYATPMPPVDSFCSASNPTCCSSQRDPSPPLAPYRNDDGVRAACYYVNRNLGQASRLCNTLASFRDAYTKNELGSTGPYHVLVVEVLCDAQYSFGRILNLSDRTVSAYAIAAIGRWDHIAQTFGPFLAVAPTPTSTDASRLVPD
jgi:hypothetical protein